MREYSKKPENQSRTSENNPRASKQASIGEILQSYRDRTLGKAVQRQSIDEEELLQGKFESTPTTEQEPVQQEEKSNNTGLPDNLKTGIENLSGYSMDDVKVHYNSAKPEQLQALAYAQGTDIHVAPGQEKHLPHEAWHVVQQKQGRVQPTMQMQGINVNDNEELEREADQMGNQVIQRQPSHIINYRHEVLENNLNSIQRKSEVIQKGHCSSKTKKSEENITVTHTGTNWHFVGSDNQVILQTSGMGDCWALIIFIPGHGRLLAHLPGGDIEQLSSGGITKIQECITKPNFTITLVRGSSNTVGSYTETDIILPKIYDIVQSSLTIIDGVFMYARIDHLGHVTSWS